jgi:hypothetical protein
MAKQNIQHIRLINGDEIIGDVVNRTETNLTIDHPLVVQEREDQYGQTGLVLVKYLPFAEIDTIMLSMQHVICFSSLHPVIEQYYFNSLKQSDYSSQALIDQLLTINQTMERIFHQNPNIESDNELNIESTDEFNNASNSDVGFIHKGNETIN